MDVFFKATAALMIAVILELILSKQEKSFSLLITISVCCIVMIAVVSYLEPIISLVDKLVSFLQVSSDVIKIFLKAVGIAFIGEIASMICNDAGNATLAKVTQYLASVVILWTSVPLFENLISLIDKLLGEL